MSYAPTVLSSEATCPAEGAAPITPSDTVNLGARTRAIYIGTSGNLVAIINGDAVTFVGVVAGTILPVKATRINNTNTTAANLVALY